MRLGLFLQVLLHWLECDWGLWSFGLLFWGNRGLWNGLRDDYRGLWDNNRGLGGLGLLGVECLLNA